MPDLEKQIADWRRQMLAAGIRTPVPLEELESHLREDVERRMKSGASAREAFDAAVQRIGQAHALEAEFAKVGVALSDREHKVNRMIGAGLMALFYLMGAAWLFNLIPWLGPMALHERLVGASAWFLFPIIWSWSFTYRYLPVIPVSALGKRVAALLLSSVLGFVCTVLLVQLIPANEDGGIQSPYLGAFVWAFLPMVIGVSLIVGLERRRRSDAGEMRLVKRQATVRS
ncbi:MAG: hypothetical protein HY301_02560 [Verrucomicrobia bacterium]|nr:hypothetical protein [Verrucomicrobiota bacterium]